MANNIFTVLSPEEIKVAVFGANSGLPAYGSGSAEHWNAEYRAVAEAQKLHTLQQVIKLYEDMALVPEEDSPYYTFWHELKALVAKG